MRYLGIVKRQDSNLTLPDTFQGIKESLTYEAIQVGGDILLLSTTLNLERLKKIQDLIDSSIEDHRKTLEGLAR